jgi:hypothetical protein
VLMTRVAWTLLLLATASPTRAGEMLIESFSGSINEIFYDNQIPDQGMLTGQVGNVVAWFDLDNSPTLTWIGDDLPVDYVWDAGLTGEAIHVPLADWPMDETFQIEFLPGDHGRDSFSAAEPLTVANLMDVTLTDFYPSVYYNDLNDPNKYITRLTYNISFALDFYAEAPEPGTFRLLAISMLLCIYIPRIKARW